MERLTKRGHKKQTLLIGTSCSYGYMSYDCQLEEGKKLLKLALDKLADYEDLEEQGRLVKLPCKVGDDVYYILGIPNETPCTIDKCTFELSDINKIGKTLFLTKAEAESKLKELRGAE